MGVPGGRRSARQWARTRNGKWNAERARKALPLAVSRSLPLPCVSSRQGGATNLEAPSTREYSVTAARRQGPGVSLAAPSMDPLAQAPDWLLRPLPVNAAVDPALHGRIDALAAS